MAWSKIINNGVYKRKKPKKKTAKQIRAILDADPALKFLVDQHLKTPVPKELRVPKKKKKSNSLFYNSQEWKELRYQAIKKYGKKCMCCNSTEKTIHVDHIKPRSLYPELALEFSNLQILCEDCNLGKLNKDQTDWRGKESGTLPKF